MNGRDLIRATLVALCLAAAGGSPAAAATACRAGGGDSRLQALVVRRPAGPQDEDELVDAIAALGPSVLADLFELQLPIGFEAFLPPDVDPTTWVIAPDAVPAVALRALGRMPAKAVLAFVRERLAGERDLDLVLACARTIGATGSAEGIPLLLEIVGGLGTDWGFPHVRATVARTLESLLADPESAAVFAREWKRVEPRTRDVVVEAMLASDAPTAAEFLLAQLGEDPALDLRILARVVEPFERAPWLVASLDLGGLTGAIGSSDPIVRAQAVAVLGRLRREDGLDALILHLRDGDARVQRAVGTVLRDWSGDARPASAEEWQAWAAEEARWHAQGLSGLLGAIDPEEPPEAVMAAASELARRPIHRRDAVRELADLLPRANADFGREIVRFLVQIDGREAIPDLVDELEDSAAGLEADCWKALRALARVDLGPDAAAWRAWLGS